MKIRNIILLAAIATFGSTEVWAGATEAFDQLKSLAGEWEADFPGVGKLTSSFRLVSNGRAIEETLGTPADNEVSIYMVDKTKILMTHFCALTPDGHQVRLETASPDGAESKMVFAFVGASNLHDPSAPHMRRLVTTFIDRDHFSEKWTKTEHGKDTVIDLKFVRR